MKHTITLNEIPRRSALGLIGGALAVSAIPQTAYADAAAAAARVKEISGGAGASASDSITLDLPEIAENGNAVKVAFSIDSPMTDGDHIKAVHVLADGNPVPDVASFNFSPACGACEASTRMRLAKTQNIIVVAEKSDGTFHMAESTVKVTIGGCGG